MSCCDGSGPFGCAECAEHARASAPTLAHVAALFGRAPAPATLSGPVDDFVYQAEAELGTWIEQKSRDAADAGYDRFVSRLNQDMDGLLDNAISSAKPKLQKELYEVFDDAQTQARLGATSEQVASEIQFKMIPLVGAAAIATAAMTWALLRITK